MVNVNLAIVPDFGGRVVTEIHLHHEGGGTELDTVDHIAAGAMSREDQHFALIPYHLIIRRPVLAVDAVAVPIEGNPWTIEAGRPLAMMPASVKGRNAGAVAIVVAGRWDREPLPAHAFDRLVEACVWVCRGAGLAWTDIYGHGELAPTLCPGYDVGAVREAVQVRLEGER